MAAKLQSPGLQVSETTGGSSRIQEADTGIVFVTGIASWGPIGTPIEILSRPEAKEKLGDYVSGYLGRQCVEAMFDQGGITKVYFARTAHYAAGVLSAVKASYTAQGYNEVVEDRPKVNTLKFTARGEGVYGNHLKIDTIKVDGGALTSTFATGEECVDIADTTGFEIGDVIEVADATQWVRVIVTQIAATKLYCKAQTLGGTIVVAASSVKTCSTHKVKTTLLTGTSLATGATYADLTNASGIVIGSVVTFVDNRIAGGQPNSVTVQVTGKTTNRIFFAALGAITTIAAANSNVVTQEFNARVYVDTTQVGSEQEYLSMVDANATDYVENKWDHEYVDVADQDSTEGDIGDIPMALDMQTLASGDDGLTSLADADFTGDETAKTGMYQFLKLSRQFAQILSPDTSSAVVQRAMIQFAETYDLHPEVYIPAGYTRAQAITWLNDTLAYQGSNGRTSWPNAKWRNTEKAANETLPSAAFNAGLNARVWGTVGQGTWTQPAGVEAGIYKACQGLEGVDSEGHHATDDEAERNALYTARINPVMKMVVNGATIGYGVYGIRLMQTFGEYTQMGERCTMLWIKHSIRNSMGWTVFRNIDSVLKGACKREITAFLESVRLSGGLKGATAAEAFEVDVDGLNTATTEAKGEFYVRVGCAFKKGAEFVYFVLSRKELAELAA